MLSLPAAIFLLFGVVGLSLIPGFCVLAYYQAYVLSIPVQFAVLSILTYAFKFALSTALMCAAVMIYADLAFPFVMCSFAAIFERIKVD